jgi:hypothetical protein
MYVLEDRVEGIELKNTNYFKCKIIFQYVCITFFLFQLFLIKGNAQDSILSVNNDYVVDRIFLPDGNVIEATITPSPPIPPHGMEYTSVTLPEPSETSAISTITDVPAFSWSFGCSATSAAMIAGYYDRRGYSNMYTGPTNGGVMTLDNSYWPDWIDTHGDTRHQCPLSATHNGLDGRFINGHVDDYWEYYNQPGPDPWVSNWPEHASGDCTGDYMKTNQWINPGSGFNIDGGTTFYNYTDGSPLPWEDIEYYNVQMYDGGYGLKLFYESRGYTVTDMYNQYIYGYNGNTMGFTFDQYKAEIDAGRPVMIHVEGHTMVGVGYNDASNLLYIHNTWDYNTHTMIWGDEYLGMLHYAVTIVYLQVPEITFNNGAHTSLNYDQTNPSPPQFNWSFGQFSLNSDAPGAILNSVTLNLAGTFTGLEGTNPFRLYTSDSNDIASATPIGSDVSSSGETVIFNSLNEEIPSGTRYYWPTVDLSSSATGTINASITSPTDLDITNSTISSSSSYGLLNAYEDAPLPVELTSFTAEEVNNCIVLKWSTQSELNNLGFIIKRSNFEDEAFEEIASFDINYELKGQGTTANVTNYKFVDDEIFIDRTYYYRLISKDLAGLHKLHSTISITVQKNDLESVGSIRDKIGFTIDQNYPNPFNSSTQIKFSVSKSDYYRLYVYDRAGRIVATLFEGPIVAGNHSIKFDATGFASGIYFYILNNSDFRVTKKMIFLK